MVTSLHQWNILERDVKQYTINQSKTKVSERPFLTTFLLAWWVTFTVFAPIDWLIVYCLTSLSRIFHWYGDGTIAGEGLQIWAYARHSGPLSREGSLSCHSCYDTGPRSIPSHPKDHEHSKRNSLRFTRCVWREIMNSDPSFIIPRQINCCRIICTYKWSKSSCSNSVIDKRTGFSN